MARFQFDWQALGTTASASYICGHCGSSISSDKAYTARNSYNGVVLPYLYICHVCNKPTFIFGDEVVPSSALGNAVQNLPPDIEAIYEEIRRSTSVNAHTAAVLAARKLLMHIAVEKGAPVGRTFKQYVSYLDANHYTPPNSTTWVDSIRLLGNEANHEIVIMSRDQAKLILNFLEMLLRFIYEFPAPQQPDVSSDNTTIVPIPEVIA